MAPKKIPTSLYNLSLDATVQLFHMSAINISKLPVEHPSHHEAMDKLRSVFVEHVPFRIRTLLLETVECSIKVCDRSYATIAYSLFIHEKMIKLTLNSRHCSLVNFSELKNLVDLHLSSPSKTEQASIVNIVGRVCTHLEVIHFNSQFIPQCLRMLTDCKKLRKITYKILNGFTLNQDLVNFSSQQIAAKLALSLFPNLEYYSYHRMGDVISSCDDNLPLKLRYLHESSIVVEHMQNIIAKCPHLEHLKIGINNKSSCCDIFRMLSGSEMKINELELNYMHNSNMECIREYLERNGGNLQKLSVRASVIFLTFFEAIAKYCVNLIYLKLDNNDLHNLNQEPYFYDPSIPASALMKLQELHIYMRHIAEYLAIFQMILPRNSNVSFLCLAVWYPEDHVYEEILRLITENSMECLDQFKLVLQFIPKDVLLPEAILRELYERFPSLTYINLDCKLANDALNYLAVLHKEVEDNNLNLIVDYSA